MNTLEKFLDYHVEEVKHTTSEGVFAISPLPTGFGDTLGNILRRVLLSSIKGAAITELRIEGVPHQFSTIEGMREDIIHFILNLKGVRFALPDDKPVVLKLEASGIKEVKASDFKAVAGVTIANPTHPLTSLTTKKAKITAQVLVESGYGYVAREALEHPKIGVLPIDSFFSPVQEVAYAVEKTRVGESTDLDKLVITIKTDQTVLPREALKQSAQLLVSYFARISQQKVTGDLLPERVPVSVEVESVNNAEGVSAQEHSLSIDDLDLPLRTVNSLKKAKIESLGDLIGITEEELLNIRGLGETSIKQITQMLKKENWK